MNFAIQSYCYLRANLAAVVLAVAALVLAFEPIVWLFGTWRDPAYASQGYIVAAAVALIAVWSASSPAEKPSRSDRVALTLLALSAIFRMAGQLLAINVLSALTLVADVYALGLLLRLSERRRAASPGWVAVMFAFSLPLERMLQRSLGYPLQEISAEGACRLLKSAFTSVSCEGVRIVLDGRDVLVDLPCSGARGLLLSLLAFAAVAAVTRPRLGWALAGGGIVLASAIVANMARISLLAVGIAHPELLGGVNVMAAPWHDAIGYVCLGLSLAPLAIWTASAKSRSGFPVPQATDVAQPKRRQGGELGLRFAGFALAGAVVVVSLPRKPVDIAAPAPAVEAPIWILGLRAEPRPVEPREADYFLQFGGSAVKAAYGPHGLMLVKTSSPLRHLHTPDECMRGMGFSVQYGGMTFAPVPTAHYLGTSVNGERYRIDVSFVSDQGAITASVAGAVWLWINGQARTWTTIQRISPADLPVDEQTAFSWGALQALGIDFAAQQPSPPPSKG